MIKKLFIIGFVGALLAGGIWSCAGSVQEGPIYSYQEQRDMAQMLPLYERNLYWMTVHPDSSSFRFQMKYRTPDENPLNFGKLYTKVFRENARLVGFVSYYMSKPTVGKILYVVVDESVRGKRYGQKLLEFAMDELKKMGARTIKLVTRPHNLPGHALYKRVGFHETGHDEIHSYFSYDVK